MKIKNQKINKSNLKNEKNDYPFKILKGEEDLQIFSKKIYSFFTIYKEKSIKDNKKNYSIKNRHEKSFFFITLNFFPRNQEIIFFSK